MVKKCHKISHFATKSPSGRSCGHPIVISKLHLDILDMYSGVVNGF